MKKTLALLLTLALAVLPASVPVFAADSYLLTIAEDTVLTDASDNGMAVYLDGIIYTPYTTLQKLSGVGCSYNAADQMVTVFRTGNAIYFELDTGNTHTIDRQIPLSAKMRGGVPYLPIQLVCIWLNLYFAFVSAADSGVGYPVIRVAGKTPTLSEAAVISRNQQTLADVAGARNVNSGLVIPGSDTPPAPPPAPAARDISLLFLGAPDDSLSDLLDTLEASRFSAAFFFPSDGLAGSADQMRQVFCRDFSLGILLTGDDPVAEAEAASAELASLLHIRVRLVTAADPETLSQQQRAALSRAGFQLWIPTIDVYAPELTAPRLRTALQQALRSAESGGTLLLRPDELTQQVLPVICSYLTGQNFTVLPVREWTEAPG
ncbi:MAG: hypothetical protein IJT76_07150 [Clostridia bacterium]|nr:hypothetical protein [Clostridia bacterium]